MRPADIIDHRSARATDIIAALFFAAIVARHLQHGTAIFDIVFTDETYYLWLGHTRQIIWSSHDWSGLYLLYYRVLSIFLPDRIDLYLYGGLILVAACAVAIFLSLRALSASPIYALVGASIFIFSGRLLVWPRISFLAIVVIAAGLVTASQVRPAFSKCAVILLTAFLAAFIRPEYVLVVDLMAVVCLVLAGRELFAARRGGSVGVLFRNRKAVGWLCLAAVAVLALVWTFPLMRSDQRALIAFAQHYAFRFVSTNQPEDVPKWALIAKDVFDTSFPGAKSVGDAIRIAPGLYAKFVLANGWDFLKLLARSLQKSLPMTALGVFWGSVCLAVIVIGLVIARRPAGSAGASRGADWNFRANLLAVAVLMLPPLLACLLIFPREHYEIIVLYLLLAAVALCVRAWSWLAPSTAGTFIVGAALLVATPVVPRHPQETLRDIVALRQVPGIKTLYESHGGFCIYYQPPCESIWPTLDPVEPLEKLIADRRVDAIISSRDLAVYAQVAPQPMYEQLFADPERFGFKAYRLPSGQTLLKKQAE